MKIVQYIPAGSAFVNFRVGVMRAALNEAHGVWSAHLAQTPDAVDSQERCHAMMLAYVSGIPSICIDDIIEGNPVLSTLRNHIVALKTASLSNNVVDVLPYFTSLLSRSTQLSRANVVELVLACNKRMQQASVNLAHLTLFDVTINRWLEYSSVSIIIK